MISKASNDFERRIPQALGHEPADIVIKNVRYLNVITGKTATTDIAITGHTITGIYGTYEGQKIIDGKNLTAVPGFIDAHVHVESSLITPQEFDRCVLPRGTTTAMCDPHEIANVLGSAGLRYFQRASEHTLMDLMVQLSSCVPATELETSGATIDAAQLMKLRHHPRTIGLAEFMNIGGVLGQSPDVIAKLDAFRGSHIDGHLPGIGGYALNAMAACGIRNCHENSSLANAAEKLAKGVQVFIREGTICKDLLTLISLINTRNSPFLGFCTDDRNPLEIAREGHIDHLIRGAIQHGADPRDVYRIASWSAAQGIGLHQHTDKWQARGLISPGYKADIVLLSDVRECTVHSVIKNGQPITEASFEARKSVRAVGYNSVKVRELIAEDFKAAAQETGEPVDVIGLIPHQIVTNHLRLDLPRNAEGLPERDSVNDVLKIAIIERHGRNGNIAVSFVKGFGFKSGALASSVGHDSHNIIVVGTNDEDMAIAANRIKANQGGYVVVQDKKVIGEIALPIAGLMSNKPFEAVRADLVKLRKATNKIGSALEDPTMMLAFLPLCVIPTAKLTDFGLVRFDPAIDQGPVLLRDQRGMRRSALRCDRA